MNSERFKTGWPHGCRLMPELARPGAGIPLREKFYVRFVLLPRELKEKSWETIEAQFNQETIRILEMTEPLTDARLAERVLVDRIPGIEDSSRLWSAAMVMDHLQFVGEGMFEIMKCLTQGRIPGVNVDTADLKPSPARDVAQVRSEFRAFAHTFIPEVKAMFAEGDRESKLTHLHPWFGRLSTKGWFWVMTAHQGVHRRQIQAILGLKKKPKKKLIES